MVRRIVKCSACLKRFATASGKDLCPTCRCRTEKGKNDTKKAASDPCKQKPRHLPANNPEEETVDVFQSQQPLLNIRDDHIGDDSAAAEPLNLKKRKIQTTAATVTVAVDNNFESDTANNNDDTRNNDAEHKVMGTNNNPAEDGISKKPKIGDKEGEIIASLSTESTVANSIDEGGLCNDDGLRCITNGSNIDLNVNLKNDDETNNQHCDESCCGSENDDMLIECIEIDQDSEEDLSSHQKEGSQDKEEADKDQGISQTNNTQNDVCYICGANLGGKGFKSRVAHMKRCSTKYGPTTKTSAEVDVEEMVPVESTSKAVVSNPYKNAQWHGESGKKEKQSMLNQFFKAPIRSLTSVLMNGSRQAKKKADDIQQKGLKPGNNNTKTGKTFRKGSWAGNKRRSGQCPSYKRIPGTDFLCDGFYYADGSLTQNYFLTHFHSDHYGGIDKKWKEGVIYCSVSRFVVFSVESICDHVTNRYP